MWVLRKTRPRPGKTELQKESALVTSIDVTPHELHRVERGEAGRVLRELHAQDFVFTVLRTEALGSTCQRVLLHGNGFLRTHAPYPTMWVRLWFDDETGSGHQRAYTLVDPDVETDTFWLEFALHDGAAARWALNVHSGDQIEASLYGSEPSLPSCAEVDTHLLVGDPASLPAINSLLDALSEAPAIVILEASSEDDEQLPVRVRPQDTVRWVRRGVDSVLSHVSETLAPLTTTPNPRRNLLAECPRVFAWGACDTVTTRGLTKILKQAGLRRDCIKTLGYWMPSA